MRRRGRYIFLLLMAVFVIALIVYQVQIVPILRQVAEDLVINQASDIIGDAVGEQLAAGTIDYDAIITLDKNAAGQVTALHTNMQVVNQLRQEIITLLSQRIMELNVAQLSVPLGSVISPSVFSQWGPRIPVSVSSVNNIGAHLESQFTSAGINQTLNQLVLYVSMDVGILVANGTKEVTVSQQVVVAETVIVGAVPDAFLDAKT